MRGARAIAGIGVLLLARGASAAFEAPQQINEDFGVVPQGAPSIASLPGGAVWVVFGGQQSGTFDVHLACSSNGGVAGSWSSPVVIAGGPDDQSFPRVGASIDGGAARVHVAWQHTVVGAPEGDLGYMILRAPLATPCSLTEEGSAFFDDDAEQDFLELDVDIGGNAYLAWRACPFGATCGADNYRAMVAVVRPGETVFHRTADVTDGTRSAFDPDLAVIGTGADTSLVWAAFHRPGSDGGDDMIARWSTSGGATWSVPIAVGAGTTHVRDATVAVAGSTTALFAYAKGSQLEARLGRRTPSGISWTNVQLVGSTPTAFTPHVSALDRTGIALLAWQSGFDVFAAVTLDTGGSWAPQGPIGSTLNNQVLPRGSVGSTYLAYQSNQDGSPESFFTRDITVTGTPTLHGLRATESADGVGVAWQVDLPGLVRAIAVERNGAPFATKPLLEARMHVLDPGGRAGDEYRLRATLVTGDVLIAGPVVAAGAAPGCRAETAAPLPALLLAITLVCARRARL